MNPNKKKNRNELIDLDVDRVDAVDKPAHGRAFLLFKRKDGTFGDVEAVDRREPIRKRAGYRFGVDMTSAIFKQEAPAPASRSFDPDGDSADDRAAFRDRATFATNDEAVDAEIDRFDSKMISWAGRGSVETPRPVWAKDSFLHGDQWDSNELPDPVQPYRFVEPDADRRDGPGFRSSDTSAATFKPADFSAPIPRAVRMGTGYVLRSAAPRIGAGLLPEQHVDWTTLALMGEHDVLKSRPAEEVCKDTGRVSFASVIFGDQ